MKKYLLVFCLGAALAACGADDDSSDKTVRQCGEYTVEMLFSEDGTKMTATINGDTVELDNVVSASGAKYDGQLNDTAVTLWGKGDNWMMILDDDTIIDCAE